MLVVAWKYHLLIKGTTIARSISYLLRLNLISRFYALFLPSAVGVEAVRWYKVTRNQEGRVLFLSATVFERLTFLFVLLLVGLIPLLFSSSHSALATLRTYVLPPGLASVCIVCIFMAYFIFPVIRSLCHMIIERTLPSLLRNQHIASFVQNFSLDHAKPPLCAYVLGLSLVWQTVFLIRLFLLFKAISLPLGFVDVAWMGSLVLLLQAIPVSFAGVGIREGAYAYFLSLFGFPPEKGVVIGILFFSQMLILAGIGGVLEVRESES
jgi:uncharacterized membrane protein YbhN (UPF0104 family)